MKADNDFSELSSKEGMYRSFISFAADSAVLLRDNSFPVTGRNSLVDLFAGKSDTSFLLVWEPLFEKISSSGDIGYTYGIYTNTVKSTGSKERGFYLTIWERQEDGDWKFILDTGTQGLPEESH